MQLRILGCSGGIGSGLRTTSLLIDDDILIDAGTGVGDLALDDMSKIRHIFLTHSHLDHIGFIPLLLDSIFDTIKQPLIVHGQQETIQVLKDHLFNWSVWPDFSVIPSPENPVLSYQIMSPGEICTINARSFEMIKVNHTVPAVGYRVACDSGAFAFSGDTTTNDTLWDALNAHDSLDLLIVEASYVEAEHEISALAHHYNSASLALDIKKLQHRPRIFLSHHKPGSEKDICQECQQKIPHLDVQSLSNGAVFKF